MSGFASANEEKDLEKHTQQSTDESPERDKYESPGNSYQNAKRLGSNTLSGDSVSPESRTQSQSQSQSQTQSSSHCNFIATAFSQIRSREVPINQESFSHPLLEQPTGTEVIVDFDGKDDPYRPMNWPFRKKVITTCIYGFTTCWITFASAIYSSGVQQIAHDFDVSIEVSTVGISVVVLGFGLGPLVWAPLSEVYGRKVAVLTVSCPL